jgi:tetratricopeptide (TPR) repeat protein
VSIFTPLLRKTISPDGALCQLGEEDRKHFRACDSARRWRPPRSPRSGGGARRLIRRGEPTGLVPWGPGAKGGLQGRANDILLPFAKKEVANFDLCDCPGKAFQEAGDIKKAIPWNQKALSHKGNVIEVLNSLGECYFKIDDKGQALRAWEKSLEINPNQENSKKMIERLRG